MSRSKLAKSLRPRPVRKEIKLKKEKEIMSAAIATNSFDNNASPAASRENTSAYEQAFDNYTGRQARAWQPPVDIHETRDEIVLCAQLPGVRQNDLKVNLENNVLMIAGQRHYTGENVRAVLRVE